MHHEAAVTDHGPHCRSSVSAAFSNVSIKHAARRLSPPVSDGALLCGYR